MCDSVTEKQPDKMCPVALVRYSLKVSIKSSLVI